VTVCENREALDSSIPDAATWRLAHVALQYARDNRRKRVTVVTGARGEAQVESNRLGSLREAAEDFPEIELAELAVDDARGQLIQRPERFDVVLLRSPHGDQLLDLCAGLVGGPGLVPGASIGGEAALFEPAHGAGPEHGGLNRANPLAMMLCGVLLLRHLEEHEAAGRLERAIADVIAEGKMLTYDMKSDRHDTNAVGTSQVADGVVAKLLTVKAAA
jgi:isocitrate dehydrogenase (NAD+)